MINLLEETIEDIQASGHTPADIMFIGSRKSGHRCTWDEYRKLADLYYDNGYGGQKIAQDLEIVFSDGSGMTRGEYDGSEWWQYSIAFIEPEEVWPITTLIRDGSYWRSLGQMNEAIDLAIRADEI